MLSQVDVARVLLLAGADSHARDYRSRCPLHMAALCGKSEIVSCLLTCGADPNKASDLGTTALHNAVSAVLVMPLLNINHKYCAEIVHHGV